MKIKLEEALKIYEKYGSDTVPLIYLSDVYISTANGVLQINQGMKFEESQVDMLIRANISEIDVIFTDKLLAKLIATFPSVYRYPQGRKNFLDMDRMIDELDKVNGLSRKKRAVVSCTEVYRKNPQGQYEIVMRYGERLNYSRWNEIKVRLGRTAEIDYRIDEAGIIVFIIMSPGSPSYMKRFMMNTELISLIVDSKSEFNFQISPDFNPDTDVFPVNDANELLTTYKESKAKLVIIGGELDEDYKRALAKLKAYDKYVRMMLVKNADPKNKQQILMTIRQLYNQNLWERD